jgi:hypothetical protein
MLLELFERMRGREVSVLPHSGNCSDGLIALGLRALLERYDVRFSELRHPLPATGRILLVPAGGNLCSTNSGTIDLLSPYVDAFDRVYLLPCSIETAAANVAEFLRGLPAHVEIFCRERYSYAQARLLVSPDRVYLDRDLAFFYDYEPWKMPGAGRLNAFRTDRESIGRTLPKDNLDIPALGSQRDGKLLPTLIRHYAIVHTDRAHVAICAAMLGKETHMYPNGYHKVRGIYEQALADMPNVHFHSASELAMETIA